MIQRHPRKVTTTSQEGLWRGFSRLGHFYNSALETVFMSRGFMISNVQKNRGQTSVRYTLVKWGEDQAKIGLIIQFHNRPKHAENIT